MPTYEYRCTACDHEFEQYQSITAEPLKKCPACGRARLARLLGAGGGVLFKGSGFYQTDYRSESYRKAAAAEKNGGQSNAGKSPTADKPAAEKPAADKPAAEKPATAPGRAKSARASAERKVASS